MQRNCCRSAPSGWWGQVIGSGLAPYRTTAPVRPAYQGKAVTWRRSLVYTS